MEGRSRTYTEKVQLLSDDNVPEYLNIADAPPGLGGTVRKMSPQEFIKESGSGMERWTGTVEYPAEYVPVNNSGNQLTKSAFKRMMVSIADIDKSLVIAYMNDKVGYGVFTLNVIPANTAVMIYEGRYHIVNKLADMVALSGPYVFVIGSNYTEINGMIDAELIGGKARYVQYAPSKTREKHENADQALGLADYTFKSNVDEKNVAYANLLCCTHDYKGKQFLVYKTGNEPIPANHGLFVDYSKSYWLGIESIPRLFFKQGGMLEEGSYKPKLITFKLFTTPAHTEHLLMTNTYENWKQLFSEGYGHIFYADQETQQAIFVEEKTFDDALDGKFKDAPFIVIDRPVVIAPLAKIRQFGIFACKENASICTELYWITGVPGWKYNEEGKTAFLVDSNKEVIGRICNLLASKGFDVTSGTSSRGPTIHVKNPNLKMLQACSKELEQTKLKEERKTRKWKE